MLTTDELIEELRREVRCAGSVRKWCRNHSIAPGNVSAVLAGSRALYPALVRALGAEIRFVRPRLRP